MGGLNQNCFHFSITPMHNLVNWIYECLNDADVHQSLLLKRTCNWEILSNNLGNQMRM